MRKSVRYLLPAGAFLLLYAGTARAQIATIEFNVPGPADWGVASNWLAAEGSFVPGDGYPAEVAGISNGGIAVVTTSTLPPVSGIVLGDGAIGPKGTLRINTGGSLVATSEGAGSLAGEVLVGAGTQGILEINGGTLSADILNVLGANNSELRLQGAANVVVSGSALLARKATITGPNVNFSVGGDLTIAREFHPVITGTAHSAIQVPNGTTYVVRDSSAILEFSGYTPKFGDSWGLVESSDNFGEFATVSSATQLARGLALDATYDGGISVGVENRLILNVNRQTGAAKIENAVGAPISIDSYSIGSAGGYLLPAAGKWTSLDDANVAGWEEASPSTTRLSELNPTGTTAFAVGQSRAIGTPYAFAPTAFGQLDTEGLTFTYLDSNGVSQSGIVEMDGDVNNLVLYVDPATGAAAVDNQSPFSISLDFYSISSASGSLSPTGWDSLDDQSLSSWDEATPTVTRLSELNPTASTLFASGSLTELGNLFTVGGTRDLAFKFTSPDGTLYDGIVKYASIPDAGVLGDTDSDGDVDLTDLNNVRNNFGGAGVGDTDNDNDVDLTDLNNVRNNFGATGSQAVPEPSSFVLIGLGLAGLAAARRAKK